VTRIVAVADTHTFHGELTVPDGDIFVHAGDMCRGGTLDELAMNVEWLRALPHRHKIIVAGNHDWCFAREPDEAAAARSMLAGMTYLQDSEATVHDLRFYGSPWQPAYNDWAFNLPRGKPLADVWSRIPTGIDVLITHGPPNGYGDRYTMAGRGGCEDLRRRVALVKPRLHMFGHIHQDGGLWTDGTTTFCNVTTWECERPPTVIDIDTSTVTAITIPPHGRRDDLDY